jgi:hypothetical protein
MFFFFDGSIFFNKREDLDAKQSQQITFLFLKSTFTLLKNCPTHQVQ